MVTSTRFVQGKTHRWAVAWSFDENLAHRVRSLCIVEFSISVCVMYTDRDGQYSCFKLKCVCVCVCVFVDIVKRLWLYCWPILQSIRFSYDITSLPVKCRVCLWMCCVVLWIQREDDSLEVSKKYRKHSHPLTLSVVCGEEAAEVALEKVLSQLHTALTELKVYIGGGGDIT